MSNTHQSGRRQRQAGLSRATRSDPTKILQLWYALDSWHKPAGAPALETRPRDGRWFAEVCNKCDPLEVVRGLLRAGCPPDLLPPLPEGKPPSADDVRAARQELRAFAPHMDPDGALCFEVAASLEYGYPDDVLWLEGVRAIGGPEDKDAFVVRRGSDEPWVLLESEYQELSAGLEVVQDVAWQVAAAASGEPKVQLAPDQIRRLQRLVRAGGERPEEKSRCRIGLVEVESRKSAVAVTWHGIRKAEGPDREVPRSWLHDEDERRKSGLPENWVLSRAAGFLVDYCRGVEAADVGQCPICQHFWAEKRGGRLAKYCPECRQLDLRTEERTVELEGDTPYIEIHRTRWVLGCPAGRQDLPKGTKVHVIGGKVALMTDPSIEVPVLHRVPVKRMRPNACTSDE